MTARRLAPIDAQTFWLAPTMPNDTFLLFGFAGVASDLEHALSEVRARARGCQDLSLRVDDRGSCHYPAWEHRDVDRSQFVVHDLDDRTWAGCLAGVGALMGHQVDAADRAWRLHVFPDVVGMPGVPGAGTVAVLQISHALGGGGRTSAHAALIFGRPGAAVPDVHPPEAGPWAMVRNGIRAARAHRELLADQAAGGVPGPAGPRPLLRTNGLPSGARRLGMVVRPRSALGGPTVTVAALAAISTALAGQLRALGDDPSALGAEVPMAKSPPRLAYNHFGNVGIGLHPDLPGRDRMEMIADELAARRRRAAHVAMRASDLAFASTPASLLRWGMRRFDPYLRVDAVTGNTVVSSVNCGAADFGFGGAPVVMASAFAALSPMVGLTHVVVGVGDTVTIGVHAADSALGGAGGLDDYLARLQAALPSR